MVRSAGADMAAELAQARARIAELEAAAAELHARLDADPREKVLLACWGLLDLLAQQPLPAGVAALLQTAVPAIVEVLGRGEPLPADHSTGPWQMFERRVRALSPTETRTALVFLADIAHAAADPTVHPDDFTALWREYEPPS